jgi:hypothetical protein
MFHHTGILTGSDEFGSMWGNRIWPILRFLSHDLSEGIKEHYKRYYFGQPICRRIKTNNKKIKNYNDGRETGAVQDLLSS